MKYKLKTIIATNFVYGMYRGFTSPKYREMADNLYTTGIFTSLYAGLVQANPFLLVPNLMYLAIRIEKHIRNIPIEEDDELF